MYNNILNFLYKKNLILYKEKYILIYFISFLNKKKLNKIKRLKWYLENQVLFCFLIKILKNKIKLDYKYLNILNNNYLINLYNIIDKNFNTFSKTYINYNNIYFFWYFFNQDSLIKMFVNLIMKKGKKYVSYKNVYNCLFFIKKIIGIQPIVILKKFLFKNRFLFNIKSLTLKNKVITIPKLLSARSQLTKSLKFLLNNFNLKNWKIKKKHISFYKKIGYLILNSLFNSSSLKKLIKEDTLIVKNNFKYLRKDELFSKYVKKIKNINKKTLFKIKRKYMSKKMKFLSKRSSLINQIKKETNVKKYFLLNRYNVNIQCKNKLRSKWF